MSKAPKGKSQVRSVQFEATLLSVTARSSRLIHPKVSIDVTRTPDIPTNFAQEALPILTIVFNDRRWDADTVREVVLTPSSCQLLITARTAEKLIGFATVHSTVHPNIGKLHWLAVVPEWQRKGIGTALTLTVCRIASTELKHETITLKTETYRSVAISLYRKLGFREIPTP
jgi:ribosomal protein S18 acetylase RimI-like enzyme